MYPLGLLTGIADKEGTGRRLQWLYLNDSGLAAPKSFDQPISDPRPFLDGKFTFAAIFRGFVTAAGGSTLAGRGRHWSWQFGLYKETFASAKTNRFPAMEIDNPAVDYVSLAASMGAAAQRVTRASDIAPSIEAGIASGEPNLIEVVIAATWPPLGRSFIRSAG